MIFLREWKFFRNTTYFWIVLAATWLSLGLGAWNGYQRWSSQVKQARLLNQQVEDTLAKTKARLVRITNALNSGHPEFVTKNELIWGPRQMLYVNANDPPVSVLPAAPLAFLATGRSDTLPRSYLSSAWRGLEPNAPTTDDPVALLIGDFDLKFVILALLPLILVLSCFDLLTTEREDGTLRLILSQPISFGRLLLYRAAVRGALVIGSLLVAVAALALTVYLAGGAIWTGRLAAYVAVAIAYLSLWLLIAVCVNLLGRSGAANSLLMGGIWAVLVIFAPGVTPVIAEALSPTPSRALYIDLERAARLEVYNGSSDAPSTRQHQHALLDAFYKRHPEWASDRSLSEYSMFGAARGEAHSLKLAAITKEYNMARERQDRTIARLSVFSFSAAADSVLTGLSGNSDARQAAFLDQSLEYFAKVKRHFWPKIFRDELFTPAQFAEIPRFSFGEPKAGAVFRTFSLPLAVLAFWSAAIVLATLWQLRRKPILLEA